MKSPHGTSLRADAMMRALCTFVLAVYLSAGLSAQALPVDRVAPAWPEGQQKAANIASNVALWSAVAVDTWGSWRAEHRRTAFLRQGLRLGIAGGASALIKRLVQRQRPCAPACGLEQADASFLSGHTALAFSTTGTQIQITVPLAASTGYLRVAAKKHWVTDVLAGAAVGWAADRISREVGR